MVACSFLRLDQLAVVSLRQAGTFICRAGPEIGNRIFCGRDKIRMSELGRKLRRRQCWMHMRFARG